jgi:hypothetical protein
MTPLHHLAIDMHKPCDAVERGLDALLALSWTIVELLKEESSHE